jgi:hypothetical protein
MVKPTYFGFVFFPARDLLVRGIQWTACQVLQWGDVAEDQIYGTAAPALVTN